MLLTFFTLQINCQEKKSAEKAKIKEKVYNNIIKGYYFHGFTYTLNPIY